MTYDSVVLADAPTHFYALDETSGTTFADAGSSPVAATLTGSGATLGATVYGRPGVEFAADGTYLSAAVSSAAATATFECLIHVFSDSGTGDCFAVGYDDDPLGDTGARQLGLSSGLAQWATEGIALNGSTLAEGDYHLVGRVGGGTIALSVNGVTVNSDAYTASTAAGALLIHPGSFGVGSAHIAVSKVAVWDGTYLTDDQIAAHFAALSGGGGGGGAAVGTRIAWDVGLQLGTDGSANFDPPVTEPPTPLPERFIGAQAIESVTIEGTNFTPIGPEATRPWTRYRLLVGGKDVTFFRGVQTPMPTYSLISPLLYGSGSLTFPQIHAAFERPGHGALSWLKKFATVRLQRLGDDGQVVEGGARDFVGFVADFQHSGRDFTVTLGGEATGRASLQDRPQVIFPQTNDIGGQVMRTIQHSLRLPIANTPTTGVELQESGGTGSQMDWLTETLAKSVMLDGTMWTVMPSGTGAYRMFRKDLETIDATVYIDGFRVSESLKRDFTEEPNRVWAQGVTKDGKRVRFANTPGLTLNPRNAFPGTLSPGDAGDDVLEAAWRLFTVGRIAQAPFDFEWTTSTRDPMTRAVKSVQDDANLSQTGVINAATWDAIFDPSVTGYTLRRAAIKPAARRLYTQAFLFNSSGQVIGLNPKYDRTHVFVDASIDVGAGWEDASQIQDFAQTVLADENAPNWVGTITIYTGAVIDGEHNPGDDLTPSDLRDVRSLRPGMNLWLPTWDGGALIHISGVSHSKDSCELTVDTRARDTMTVWEVIQRNRESRRNPDRQWIAQNRRSGIRDDTGAFYDAGSFGRIEPVFCPANQWTVFCTPAGRSGTLNDIHIRTSDSAAKYGLWISGRKVTPQWLEHHVGDMLTEDGQNKLEKGQDDFVEQKFMVYAAGTKDQPCGYYPRRHTNDAGESTDAPITGDFRDRAGAPYYCKDQPVLWVAIRPNVDTTVQGGRILDLLLDDSAY